MGVLASPEIQQAGLSDLLTVRLSQSPETGEAILELSATFRMLLFCCLNTENSVAVQPANITVGPLVYSHKEA